MMRLLFSFGLMMIVLIPVSLIVISLGFMM